MNCKKLLALAGAVLVSAAAMAANAAAAGTKVTVRVEGKNRTLLAPTIVHTHAGWITKGGVAAGKCSARSGQGALDVATHRSWAGTYDSSLKNYFIKTILGETDNGPKYYWSIYVNNRSANTGGCGIKLRRGDQLLFAATIYPEYPLGLSGPAAATTGHAFTVKVVHYTAAGRAKPLARARVTGSGVSGVTNRSGLARINPTHAGTLVLRASAKRYVRAAPLRVRVS